MAEYYLISQLPSLDGISDNSPLPVTQDRFRELCSQFLNKKAYKELERLSLIPSKAEEKSSFSIVEKWNENERNLRLALAKLRAEKMNRQYDTDGQLIPAVFLQYAREAVEIESPMDAEIYLNRCRLQILEALRPMDSFSDEFVFYYAIKLMIIERIKKFDALSGEKAYRNIYDSIMNNDRQEVI